MKPNMQENFKNLERRTIDALDNTDLKRINYELSKISTPTLVSGVGGSSVVSEYASKILSRKNNIITRNTEPRDFKYLNLKPYDNVLACSYSGNNYGVDLAFSNNLKHYLLASKTNTMSGIINLNYQCTDYEKSFISLAATLIPCSILLNYYLDNRTYLIIDSIDDFTFNFNPHCDAYEIFSGYDTSTLSKYLESTMTEAGIGIPIVHDKYSYCHGRSTLSTVSNNNAIFFDSGTELDQLLLEEIKSSYQEVIVLKNYNYLSEFTNLLKCMYLTKYIAESREQDLSLVKYNPIVKKLYKYHGNI